MQIDGNVRLKYEDKHVPVGKTRAFADAYLNCWCFMARRSELAGWLNNLQQNSFRYSRWSDMERHLECAPQNKAKGIFIAST
jgi:hypothetical protein